MVSEVALIADAADGVVHDRDRTHLRLAAPLRHVYDARDRHRQRQRRARHARRDGERDPRAAATPRGPTSVSRSSSSRSHTSAPIRPRAAARHSTCGSPTRSGSERPTLFGAGPRDRVHTIETADEAPTTVIFGDGVEGARLPTGDGNVRATYRKGIGALGNVRAGSLTTLLAGPLGVTGVVNPEPASGGEDPESLAAARDNAPLTVLTLDRAVSLPRLRGLRARLRRHRQGARHCGSPPGPRAASSSPSPVRAARRSTAGGNTAREPRAGAAVRTATRSFARPCRPTGRRRSDSSPGSTSPPTPCPTT